MQNSEQKFGGGTADRPNSIKLPSKEEIEKLNKAWVHRRIVLDRMDDEQAPEPRTQALVVAVDDIGDLICNWDNGSGLKLIIGKDVFHIIESEDEMKISLEWHKRHQEEDSDHALKCPRCGRSLWKEGSSFGNHPALSRLADVMICSECGAEEALIIAAQGLKEQGIRLNISGASDETKENLMREKLTDWWLVREWRGQ